MLKLQIKDAGSWRNMVSFDDSEQLPVLKAAADLLRSLQQPNTVLRVMEGDRLLATCAAPACLWLPEGMPAPQLPAGGSAGSACDICDGSGTWFGKVCVCRSVAGAA